MEINKTDATVRNIMAVVSYDGSAYHGFQRQPNAVTVQAVLERGLARILGETPSVAGAARTDAGVHAYGQVISFRTLGSIPAERIPAASRGVLPADIMVRDAVEVPDDFHARFSALGKTYIYRILNTENADPFLRNFAWHYRTKLVPGLMNEALELIVGEHDFSSFQATGSSAKNPVRILNKATCRRSGSLLEFEFHGNGFLYHMVRNIVGTIIGVGTRIMEPHEFLGILRLRDRKQAGITAPPQGLYLKEVYY